MEKTRTLSRTIRVSQTSMTLSSSHDYCKHIGISAKIDISNVI